MDFDNPFLGDLFKKVDFEYILYRYFGGTCVLCFCIDKRVEILYNGGMKKSNREVVKFKAEVKNSSLVVYCLEGKKILGFEEFGAWGRNIARNVVKSGMVFVGDLKKSTVRFKAKFRPVEYEMARKK